MMKNFPICYETLGDPLNPCIILISGLGGQLVDWPVKIKQELVARGFYTITFDNRDSGFSYHYDELGTPNFKEFISAKQQGIKFVPPYTLEDMSSDVISLMDELHIKNAHIVGASMGGIIAQYVALNYPNRTLSLTCIYSTTGDPSLPPAKKEVLDFFANTMSGQDQTNESILENKLKLFKTYNHPDYFNEEDVRQQITLAFRRSHYPDGFNRTLLAMMCEAPRTNKLSQINLPCLIIHGDYDPVFSIEHGVHLAKTIKNSHLEVIEKLGHGLPDFFCNKIVDLISTYLIQDQSSDLNVSISK